MNKEIFWNETTISKLKEITRKCKFDFRKVSLKMKAIFHDIIKDNDILSEDNCRLAYSNNQHSRKQTSPIVDSTIQTIESKTMFVNDVNDYEHMISSFNKRKEDAFDRVKIALENIHSINPVNVSDPVISTMKNKINELELKSERLAQEKEIQLENVNLKKEKERLHRRFDDDSIDSQGIDPLCFNQENIVEKSSMDDIVVPKDLMNVNMFDVFGSVEFDRILNDIERDSSFHEMSDEILEVFELLDSSKK